ncbi:MAG: hypothetical protein HQL24_01710 [Candidatus Omnitrophica bacterium]|nr:hypothetical protein [Candidatus Omnitrophota bacterium]
MKFFRNPWIIFIPVAALFLFFRFFGQPIIEYLYQHQSYDLLNKLAGNQGGMPLDYYLGRIETVFLGPIKSVLAGVLLLSICFIYQNKLTPRRFGLIIFAYLFITRFEVLLDPPYGEAITGPFIDVIWLYKHSLNYIGMIQLDLFTKGGPPIYPTCFYTLFIATLMKIIPSTPIFLLVMHLLHFIFATIVIVTFREILRQTFDEKIAIYGAILLVSLPLFQSMLELLNLEMPCLFFAMLAVYFLWQRRLVSASVTALLSNFVKDPGVIACLTVFIFSIGLFLKETDTKKRWKFLLCGLVVLIISLVKFKIRAVIAGEQLAGNRIAAFCGLPFLTANPWGKLLLIALIIFLIQSVIWWRQPREKRGRLALFFTEHYIVLIMLTISALWFLVYLNFSAMLPRYQLLLAPFMAFLFIFTVQSLRTARLFVKILVAGVTGYLYLFFHILPPWILFALAFLIVFVLLTPRLIHFSFILLILFTFFCAYGFNYPNDCDYRLIYENHCPFSSTMADSCYNLLPFNRRTTSCIPTPLERSLEYRSRLQIDKKIAKEVETNYADFLIVAPFSTAETLIFSELGYVKKGLNVQEYGGRTNLGVQLFNGIRQVDLRRTIYVGLRYERILADMDFPLDPHDKIIKHLVYGDLESLLFMGGFAIEKARVMINILSAMEYLKHKAK